MSTHQMPVYFISHGGGPWPWLDESVLPVSFEGLRGPLEAIPAEVGRTPKAILLVSAHWEQPEFTVQTHPNPPMIYDYYGFPRHTYQIQYSAPGSPEVAARVQELLIEAGIPVRSDSVRGYDHGVYAPMFVAYPNADVPIFQMSLRDGLDPQEHLEVGRALAPLRDEEVLIICSGVPSYHNMSARGVAAESEAFDSWLTDTMVHSTVADRISRLISWEAAPFSRAAHPREEHFLPGMVAVGAAGSDPGHRHYHEEKLMGFMACSGYRFGQSKVETPNDN